MKELLRLLPPDFPLSLRPYEDLGKKMGIEGKVLIEMLKDLKEKGIIRRIAVIINHRKFYPCNMMVVFRVKEDDLESIGKKIADFPEVTHLYQRDTASYWDYNLYAMIHGRTKRSCEEILERILERTGLTDYKVFLSKREFKKTGFSIW